MKRVDPAIRYRIQVSVWGDQTGDPKYRRYANGREGPYCLPIQLENYAGDDRVMFVYTFNSENVDQLDEVIEQVRAAGHRITFNVFSAPEGNRSILKLRDTMKATRDKMIDAMERYPGTVVYSYYNAEVHTQEASLRGQFGCPYPRAAAEDRRLFGIGRTFPELSSRSESRGRIVLRSAHRLCRLPSLRRRQRDRHVAPGSARGVGSALPGMARLRGHVPGHLDPGLREERQPLSHDLDPEGRGEARREGDSGDRPLVLHGVSHCKGRIRLTRSSMET